MSVGLDLIIGRAPNHIAEIREHLKQDCDRIGLGEWLKFGNHIAREPAVSGWIHLWPCERSGRSERRWFLGSPILTVAQIFVRLALPGIEAALDRAAHGVIAALGNEPVAYGRVVEAALDRRTANPAARNHAPHTEGHGIQRIVALADAGGSYFVRRAMQRSFRIFALTLTTVGS